MRVSSAVATIVVLMVIPAVQADDWPQWLGPQRDSVWRESGIVEKFPEEGLKVKWRAPVGLGYSGPAVAGGRVYVADYERASGDISNSPGGRAKLTGNERILCFHAETGNLIWKHAYPRNYSLSYPSGPRCTPCVDSGKVYSLGAEGNLYCLDAGDGSVIWHKALAEEYGVETPVWGFSAHPLVVGDVLFCVVGGTGSVAVAFDKTSGREIWRALSASEPGYCPPTMIEAGGTKQLLIWHPESLNSLNPVDGTVYWSQPLKPDYSMSIAAPRLLGQQLFASGIGRVGALFELDKEKPGANVVWRGTAKTAVYSANSTPFLEKGMIYGCDCHQGSLMGVRIEDGKRMWETFEPTTGSDRRAGHGTAFLVKHKDRFFLFSETGDLILAKLSPEGYNEISRFPVLEPTNEAFGRPVVWSHPAFARRAVYARNDKELVCVDLQAK